MMKSFDEINTENLKRDEFIEFRIQQEREGKIELFHGEYSVGLSSGTSGNRGLSVLSKEERQLYGCVLWARSGIPEHIRSLRVLFTLRTNNPSFMEPKSFGATIIYADYTLPPNELVELIDKKKLNIIAGPPSMLVMIARNSDAISHPIEAVVSYAEVLDIGTREYLHQAFGAPVVEIYQGAEGFIGSTCREGNLHINEDLLFIEKESVGENTNGASKVILTDLYRKVQPIIRYLLDDIIEIDLEPCRCGSCFRVIKLIHGRSDDIFLLKGENGETRYLFPDYVRRSINQASGNILEYQAIQHGYDSIEIRLVLQEGIERTGIEKTIFENLKWWAQKAKGQLGEVYFNNKQPERNPRSYKLIRVVRRF